MAAAVILIASLAILRGIPLGSPHYGYVFWNGSYIQPPYTFHVVRGDIYLYGSLVQRAQRPTAPPERRWRKLLSDLVDARGDLAMAYRLAAVSVDSPTTVEELAEFSGSLLRSVDIRDADTHRWFDLVVRALPATATMIDDGESLTIVDRAGSKAELLLVSVPTEAEGEIVARGQGEANLWRDVLAEGGGLFLSTHATLLVPSSQASALGTAILRAYDLPRDQQLAVMQGLVGVGEIARSLVAVGPPIPAFAQGFGSGGRARSQRKVDASNVPSNGEKFASDQWATPEANLAVAVSGRGTDGGLTVASAALHSGYRVIRLRSTQCYGGPDDRETGWIDDVLQSKAGILYVSTWGLPGWLGLEDYCSRAAAARSAARYQTAGIDVRVLLTPETFTRFVIAVTPADVASRWQDQGTIVHLDSCGSWIMRAAFNAREFIGNDGSSCDLLGTADERFWRELDSRSGRLSSVADAFSAAYEGSHFALGGRGHGATVLTPAVISYGAAPLSSTGAGMGFVLFDVGMDTTVPAESLLSIDGSDCLVDLIAAHWETDRKLGFSVRETIRRAGFAALRVRSAAARSKGMVPLAADFTWRMPCD